MDALTDPSLAQAVRPGGRTLGRLGWHIVQTLAEMPGEAGLKLEGPHMGAPVPETAAELAETYSATAENLVKALGEQWTDAMLEDDVPMYGEVWKRKAVLNALVKHEAHHRGQMTVLMRQAGLRVPGVYGPAEEDWASMGMAAQE